MNRNLIIKTIFLTILFPLINGNEKRCSGKDALSMEEDCVIIEKSKLIITGEYDDVESVKETLAKIRVIEAGVEVVGTSYEVFDFLRQVEEIKNPNGPALTFKNNKNLKSIKMENLKLLAGKEEDVLFDNDNFPIEVYENSNALQEMLHLKAAARPSLANKKCSVEFIRIVEPEVSGSGWLLYTLIATCVVLTVFVSFQTFYLVKEKRKKKKKKKSKMSKRKKKSKERSRRSRREELK
ncbi:Protein CBG11591 [Caenorhabditis briggsae]|uniref:Protein CBG11591 n=2 Tax=Caenorhabditis briggsae TaxID=6238 RepID=A8XDK7_CAEBR|nr:Protein CBG11591 [Caenorhabditis briggsae]CAP30726.1 Protein CBG11591 [Caenorhabditis briggsae]